MAENDDVYLKENYYKHYKDTARRFRPVQKRYRYKTAQNDEQYAHSNVVRDKQLHQNRSLIEIHSDTDISKYKEQVSKNMNKMQRSFINLQSKVENQVRKITHIGTKVVQLEAEKNKELQDLHSRWVEKCEMINLEHKRALQKILEKHSEKIKSYQLEMADLKELINTKEAEVAWLKMLLQEERANFKEEVERVTSELKTSTKKTELSLKKKISDMEDKITKLSKRKLHIVQKYEEKLKTLKTEKKIQEQCLHLKLLKQTSQLEAYRGGSHQEFEKSLNLLESKYCDIISRYTKQRQADLEKIMELEAQKNTV